MRSAFIVLGAVLLSAAALLVAYRLVSGRPLGLRSLAGSAAAGIANTAQMVANRAEVTGQSTGQYTNIIFLHHSTGNNLVNTGKVRARFTEQGYYFWDHGFNRQGLRGPNRSGPKYNYNVPGDNTDPDGLLRIFRQPRLPLPLNTFSALTQHEVIVFKSCFAPGNNITSDEQVEQYQAWYLEMREVMRANPDRLFIIVTMPPLNPAETNPAEAARARAFADWQKSAAYLAGQANIYTFDFFDLLAEDDPASPHVNMLRAEYQDGTDSHPNKLANESIAPIFTSFVIEKATEYRAAAGSR